MKFLSKDIKKYKAGSLFEIKINSIEHKDYNGKYLYLLKAKSPYPKNPRYLYLYAFICDKMDLDRFKIYLNKENIVKTIFFPVEVLKYNDTCMNNTMSPDEYGYLWTNLFVLLSAGKYFDYECEYIGQINFEPPKEEFLPSVTSLIWFYEKSDKTLIDFLIDKYKKYNLRESFIFSKTYSDKCHEKHNEFANLISYVFEKINKSDENE